MCDKDIIICCRCGVELHLEKVNFSYLGRDFFHEMLKCPVCGQIYVPKELAEGKMADVEKMLEGK